MRELIDKVEARIADRYDELEAKYDGVSWKSTSHTVSEVIKSEIAFLEALLTEMKAMAV
jgi:hypothetical protein